MSIQVYKLNTKCNNMLMKPMVLDSIKFLPRSHTAWLKAGKDKHTNIVLMDPYVELGD